MLRRDTDLLDLAYTLWSMSTRICPTRLLLYSFVLLLEIILNFLMKTKNVKNVAYLTSVDAINTATLQGLVFLLIPAFAYAIAQ